MQSVQKAYHSLAIDQASLVEARLPGADLRMHREGSHAAVANHDLINHAASLASQHGLALPSKGVGLVPELGPPTEPTGVDMSGMGKSLFGGTLIDPLSNTGTFDPAAMLDRRGVSNVMTPPGSGHSHPLASQFDGPGQTDQSIPGLGNRTVSLTGMSEKTKSNDPVGVLKETANGMMAAGAALGGTGNAAAGTAMVAVGGALYLGVSAGQASNAMWTALLSAVTGKDNYTWGDAAFDVGAAIGDAVSGGSKDQPAPAPAPDAGATPAADAGAPQESDQTGGGDSQDAGVSTAGVPDESRTDAASGFDGWDPEAFERAFIKMSYGLIIPPDENRPPRDTSDYAQRLNLDGSLSPHLIINPGHNDDQNDGTIPGRVDPLSPDAQVVPTGGPGTGGARPDSMGAPDIGVR